MLYIFPNEKGEMIESTIYFLFYLMNIELHIATARLLPKDHSLSNMISLYYFRKF